MEAFKLKSLLESGKSIYEMPLKVAYYARVSTELESQQSSLANQVSYYEQLIQTTPAWTFAGGYVDDGISGTAVLHRASFLQMIDDALAGSIDLIITKEISRFSRSALDSIQYTRMLLEHGVGVFFQSDNINTLSPDSELRLTIMSAIAQEEVRKLSERIKFGFKRSIEQGRVLGRDNLLGYTKKDGRLTIDERQAEVVRRIFYTYAEGNVGLRQLAKELYADGVTSANGNMLSYSTLKSILQNPKYKGYYCGQKYASLDYRYGKKTKLLEKDWVMHEDARVPKLVPEEIWARANAILKERGERFRQKSEGCQARYDYSGKIFCGTHQTACHRSVYQNKHGGREVWSCRIYRLKGRAACQTPPIYTDEIDAVLFKVYQDAVDVQALAAWLMEIYRACPDDRDYARETQLRARERTALIKKRDRLLELSLDGLLSKEEFQARNTAFSKKIAALDAEMAQISKEQAKSAARDMTELCHAVLGLLQHPPTALLAAILERAEVVSPAPGQVKMEITLTNGSRYTAVYGKKNGKITEFISPVSRVAGA